jgi:hypothetical protein
MRAERVWSDEVAKGRHVMGALLGAARKLAGTIESEFFDWHELCKDKVRRQVIVGDALLDSAVDLLFECRLSPKDEVLCQLLAATNMNNKTRLAYVLGFISKGTMQDLHHMHNIRNIFAHEPKPDYSNRELAEQVLALSTARGKKKQVTGFNFMDFYFAAGKKCADSILRATGECQSTASTNGKRKQSAESTPR